MKFTGKWIENIILSLVSQIQKKKPRVLFHLQILAYNV